MFLAPTIIACFPKDSGETEMLANLPLIIFSVADLAE